MYAAASILSISKLNIALQNRSTANSSNSERLDQPKVYPAVHQPVRVVLDVEVRVVLELVDAEALQPEPLLGLDVADATRRQRRAVLLHLSGKINEHCGQVGGRMSKK